MESESRPGCRIRSLRGSTVGKGAEGGVCGGLGFLARCPYKGTHVDRSLSLRGSGGPESGSETTTHTAPQGWSVQKSCHHLTPPSSMVQVWGVCGVG